MQLRKKAVQALYQTCYHFGFSLRRGKDPTSDQLSLLRNCPVNTVFDVGANVGLTTGQYRQLFPEARIYGFEPFPATLDIYRQAHRDDPAVVPVGSGLADTVGERTFNVNQVNETSSLFNASPEVAQYSQLGTWFAPVTTCTVSVTTLDAFTREHAIPEIQVLKLDVQGAELAALRGGVENLRRRSIALIYAEIAFVPFYEGQPLFWDLAAFLNGFGYRLHNFYHLHNAPDGQLAGGDAIWVRPGLGDGTA